MSCPSPQILIIAGEASGDLLGANLAAAIKKSNPDICLSGMGGSHMKAAGVNIFLDSDKLSVFGILEVLPRLGGILSARRTLKNVFKRNPPDLVICIDSSAFNLRMAKHAKRAGIKVLYYVAPQIWASRYYRIKKIKKYVDKMAVLFSFEEKLYQSENMPVSFVGHPIVDIAKPTENQEGIYEKYRLDPNKPIVALFPGSRLNEITRLMPIIIATTQLIQQRIPDTQFVLPLASSLSIDDIREYLTPEITIVENDTYNVLQLSQAAITASGTATLEIALHKVPMVIIYKMAPITYWIAKKLVKLPFIGLCNIVAEEQVALELIQDDVVDTTIANEIVHLLQDSQAHQSATERLEQVRIKLGSGGGSEKAANVAVEMLGTHFSWAI